jgi:hypothetical protein
LGRCRERGKTHARLLGDPVRDVVKHLEAVRASHMGSTPRAAVSLMKPSPVRADRSSPVT